MSDKRYFKIIEEGTKYELPMYRVVDGKGLEQLDSNHTLCFVRGSKVKDEEVEKREGTLHEHLLSAMIHDLKYKQSLVPSRETAIVITKLEEARMWMEERQKAREAEGVAGTYQKHSS